jgi:hypothetical protein
VHQPGFDQLVYRWHTGEKEKCREYNAIIWARNKALLGETRSSQAANLSKKRTTQLSSNSSHEDNTYHQQELRWGLDQAKLQNRIEKTHMVQRSKEYATSVRAAVFEKQAERSSEPMQKNSASMLAKQHTQQQGTEKTVGTTTPRFCGPDSFYHNSVDQVDDFSHTPRKMWSPREQGSNTPRQLRHSVSSSPPSKPASYVQVLRQFEDIYISKEKALVHPQNAPLLEELGVIAMESSYCSNTGCDFQDHILRLAASTELNQTQETDESLKAEVEVSDEAGRKVQQSKVRQRVLRKSKSVPVWK